MYPPKGGAGYGGQQPYGQQSYGQLHATGFSGNPAAGSDIGAQHALASRQSSMMGIGQETDLSSFRSTQAAQYGGPYASVYGSAALGGGQQVGGVNSKVAISSSLQGRTAYPTSAEPSKYSSGTLGSSFNDDYTSASNRAYAQKGDQFSGAKHSEYAIDRRPYAEHQSAYIGRDLQSDPARRYADPSSLSHQTDVHDHMDQASLLRQQQILKAHSLHSGPDIRQAEYLAARAAPIHGSQEYSSYGGRMDVDSHGLPIIGNPPYGAQHSASILGAPRRNAEDLIFAQGSSNAGYAVSLPAGRDYVSGKGLLGPNDSSYQGSILSRGQRELELAAVADLKDDRNALLRELDRRDEEHRRDLLREREKERERERERERDRERERSRLLERRDRERERDQKRGLDSRRDRTPPSASRDRRGSSAIRDERLRRVSPRRTPPRRISPRRVSPRREIVHRHRSPVKEKKREYVCKVHPFCFVEAERDYLSINKRYPRLSISPEFSKIVLKWPDGNLHLSLHTPVSFEHDFTEDDKGEEATLAPLEDLSKNTNIVWNAKVLLMSGFSRDSLDELCSDRSSDDRLIHFNNILRFAVLKREHSFMAIGGQWKGTVDGGDLDPSVDSSALIETAKRYAKDIIQLDLQNCQHWNPFLEIHYNRIGDDGLFSYKEITVLFVPDLSECLPTLDSWRSKWLAHRKEIVERELRLAASKKEKKSSEKESVQGDHGRAKSEKASSTKKIGKGVEQLSKDEKVGKVDEAKDGGGSKKIVSEQKEKIPQLDETPTDVKDVESTEGDKTNDKKAQGLHSVDPEGEVKKAAKKKIIRKVIKGKSADKKAAASTEETVAKAANNVDEKDAKNKPTTQENLVQETDNSAEPVKGKTFVRKRIVRKVAAAKSSQKEDNTVAEKKPEQVLENQEVKANNNKELADAAAQQTSGVKATGKKKIIRRVIKKKIPAPEGIDGVAIAQDGRQAESNTSVQKIEKEHDLTESILPEIKIKEEIKSLSTEQDVKKANEVTDDKKMSRMVGNKVPKVEKRSSSKTSELETLKNKDSEKISLDAKVGERSRHEKERSKDGNQDSRHKPHKEAKEKGMSEDPPQQPGFFLQTKRTKGSKIRSMSLSLGGLLEYNDKDIEESTFELSLFAESFNEMLQYQMGCRLLSFLEKLRKRFVIKHKQHKRQREEKHEKEREAGKSSAKRPKISENSPAEKEHPKSGTKDIKDQNHDESGSKDGEAAEAAVVVEAVKPEVEKKSDGDEVKEEDEEEEEKEEEEEEVEDMEEMFEDDDDMEDAAPTIDAVQGKADESMAEKTLVEADTKGDAKDGHDKDGSSERNTDETLKKDENSSNGTKDDQLLSSDKPDSVKEVVNKELLQAFRFFDYNKVGYIKIDDLRSILHNLGKFLSHRDVKEMVQSAFYESGSARDSRIFYKKLVRMTGL